MYGCFYALSSGGDFQKGTKARQQSHVANWFLVILMSLDGMYLVQGW